jgi:hypothetical protein
MKASLRSILKPGQPLVVSYGLGVDSTAMLVGLWRSKRMTDFIRQKGLLPSEEIDAIWMKWSSPYRLITIKEVASEDVLLDEAA